MKEMMYKRVADYTKKLNIIEAEQERLSKQYDANAKAWTEASAELKKQLEKVRAPFVAMRDALDKEKKELADSKEKVTQERFLFPHFEKLKEAESQGFHSLLTFTSWMEVYGLKGCRDEKPKLKASEFGKQKLAIFKVCADDKVRMFAFKGHELCGVWGKRKATHPGDDAESESYSGKYGFDDELSMKLMRQLKRDDKFKGHDNDYDNHPWARKSKYGTLTDATQMQFVEYFLKNHKEFEPFDLEDLEVIRNLNFLGE